MKYTGTLQRGKEFRILNETTLGAGVSSEIIGIEADSVLVSVFCTSITGTLTVRVYTIAGPGEEALLLTLPVISAPTSSLVLEIAPQALDKIRIEATYTGVCTYSVMVRGTSASSTEITGTVDTVITNTVSVIEVGPSNGRASQTTIGTSASLLIPAALTDRKGLILKNFSNTDILFIGFTLLEAVPSNGYPLNPGQAMAMDIEAGQAIYGSSSANTVDIRILEAGT